jgi:hypothetical protein
MKPSSIFFKGDRVICVNGASNRLTFGKTYVIKEVGESFVWVEGVVGGWFPSRFRAMKWIGVRKPYRTKYDDVRVGRLLRLTKKQTWEIGTYRMIRIGEE